MKKHMSSDERIQFMYRELPLVLEENKHLALTSIISDEWDVVYGDFDDKSTAIGTCDYASQTIYVSDRIITDKEFKDTFYHEVAHILTEGDSHGYHWRKMATRLGANPRAFQKHLVEGVHYTKKISNKKWLVVFKDIMGRLEVIESAGRRLKELESRRIYRRPYTKGNLWLIDTNIYYNLSSDEERIKHLTR